jgi:hypothetical protein
MKTAELIRLQTGEQGTFGVLLINREVFCMTLEPPDRQNKVDISCIPAGQYIVKPHLSPTLGEVYYIQNVIDRMFIYFHRGKYLKDTKGCILIGKYIERVDDAFVLRHPRDTFDMLQEVVGEPFHLTIKWCL